MTKCNGCKKDLRIDPCISCYGKYCYDCFPGHMCSTGRTKTQDTFKERSSGGKNKGEDVAESYFKRFDGLLYFKYGFDELYTDFSVESFMVVPQFIRCTPDYVTVYNGEFSFIEVKCCIDELKIKLTDFVEYGKWAGIASFRLFVVSGSDLYVLKYEEVLSYLSVKGNKFGRYKDNQKLYFEIPLENIQEYKK